MQQKNSTKQSRSRTRNQQKREMRQNICMACALFVMWAMVCTMFVKAWAEEQPVNYEAHMEYIEAIGGDSDVLS